MFFVFFSFFIVNQTSMREQVIHQVSKQLEKNCLEIPDKKRLLQGALSGLVSAVEDSPYTKYIPSQDQINYIHEMQGQFTGIGLSNLLKDKESGEFYFVPLRNSPAVKMNLKFGDRIVTVDDQDVSPLSFFELINLLRGKENTTVKLKIRQFGTSTSSIDSSVTSPVMGAHLLSAGFANSSLKEVVLKREIIQQDVVSGDRLDSNNEWIFTLENYPNIGYIKISEFTDSTAKQTLKALGKLKVLGITKIILDFRGNPGGFLQDAVTICNELLPIGSPIVETRNRYGIINRYIANKRQNQRFQVAVLIDNDSASASEIVAAALQDAGVAKVIGTRSYGKGTIQATYELPCNIGILRMTTASFWRPSGVQIHRSKKATEADTWGVTPDKGFEVPVSLIQKFYSNLIRSIRVLQHETSPELLQLTTKQTNDMLENILKGQTYEKFEVIAELGLNFDLDLGPRQTSQQSFNFNLPNELTSKSHIGKFVDFTDSFKPQGSIPYFDPQLDKAINYLLESNSNTMLRKTKHY